MSNLWADNRFEKYRDAVSRKLTEEGLEGEEMSFWDDHTLKILGVEDAGMRQHILTQIEVLCHLQHQHSMLFPFKQSVSNGSRGGSHHRYDASYASDQSGIKGSANLLGFGLNANELFPPKQSGNELQLENNDSNDGMYGPGVMELSISLTPKSANP